MADPTPLPDPQTPPAVRDLGTIPDIDTMGEVEYNIAAEQVSKQWPGWSADLGALGANVFGNAQVTKGLASTAQQAAVDASNAGATALALSHFKGLYENLSGPLSIPASTKYANRMWLLVRNVANVQAEVPGVSDAWSPNDSGQVVTQKITANTQAIAGVKYLIAAPNITLTVPVGLAKGDRFGYQLVTAISGQKLDFGTVRVMGNVLGLVEIDVPVVNDNWQFEDETLGLIAQ